MHVRDNPCVTLNQNKAGTFPRDHFYKQPITLKGNACLIDSSGEVLARLFSGIVPEHLLQKLEVISRHYRKQVIATSAVDDVRGHHVSTRFGSCVERGGSGKIHTTKHNKHCDYFLEAIEEVGQFVSEVFRQVCPEVALDVIAHVPKEMQLWPGLTLMFWNATTVTVNHVDVRDLIWSLVLLFGKFTGGNIDLPYLNTKIQAH